MTHPPGLKPAVKLVAFWLGFILLHYLYEWFPIVPFALVSGVSESVFQHAKIAFYIYLIVSGVEYAIYANKVSDKGGYIFSRLLTAAILPWVMMMFWYIGPALVGAPMPSIPLEIIYANVVVICLGITLLTLQKAFAYIPYTRGVKVVILVLLGLAVMHFTIFTFVMPWADVFTPPVY